MYAKNFSPNVSLPKNFDKEKTTYGGLLFRLRLEYNFIYVINFGYLDLELVKSRAEQKQESKECH